MASNCRGARRPIRPPLPSGSPSAPTGRSCPCTTPVSLVLALDAALAMIEEEGLPAVLERHRVLSAALRAGCEALGLPIFPIAPMLSSTVTVARVPEGLDGTAIVRHMHARYRTVIAGQ